MAPLIPGTKPSSNETIIHSSAFVGHFPYFPRTSSFCSSKVDLTEKEMQFYTSARRKGVPGAVPTGIQVQKSKGFWEEPSKAHSVHAIPYVH